MSDLLAWIVFSVVACVVISIVFWLQIGTDKGSVEMNVESQDKPNARRVMQGSDWIVAAINGVAGVFLGVVVHELVQLFTTGNWGMAVFIPVVLFGAFFFGGLFDRLADKIFPSGMRAARKPQSLARAPLARSLSLPTGIVLGFALAGLGLGSFFLGLLP